MTQHKLLEGASVISSLDFLTAKEVTQVHLEALKSLAPAADEKQLLHFAYFCHSYQLDPFARQIHFLIRRSRKSYDQNEPAYNEWEVKPTIQIGIEGRLVIAERSGKFAGLSAEIIRGKDDKILGAKAKATRKDGAVFEEEVLFEEFKQDGHIWKKMPVHMIKKCAKNAVLKDAFPLDRRWIKEFHIEDLDEDTGQTLPEREAETPAAEVIPEQPKQQSEPKEEKKEVVTISVPICQICKNILIISKKGDRYFCPKWQDKSKGEHSGFKVTDLDKYLAS